jgi:hypothetical protein
MIKALARVNQCMQADGGKLAMSECEGETPEQLWSVDGEGWGPLTSKGRGTCVEIVDGKVVQSSCKTGVSAQQFTMQEGAIRSRANPGQCLQVSGTSGAAPLELSACHDDERQRFYTDTDARTDTLRGNQAMYPGQSITSRSGRYTATYSAKADGQLTISDNGRVRWTSDSPRNPGTHGRCVMRADGTLILYTAKNTPYWFNTGAPRASGMRAPCRLQIGDDGMLRIIDAGGKVGWQSNAT